MKKIFLITSVLLALCGSLFAEPYTTGDSIRYFPFAAPRLESKGGDSRTSCYITKIAKAAGYPEGTYELQLVSADWVGASVFPVTFTYIVKKGGFIFLSYNNQVAILFVKSITDNNIELVTSTDSNNGEEGIFE